MDYLVVSFYKYISLDYPEGMRDYLRALCEDHNLLGRILLAKEGVNAAVCGEKEEIQKFKSVLKQNTPFKDLTFREQASATNAYHKLVVRVRKEIVAFGTEVNMQQRGTPLSPEELQQCYEQQHDFVIVDARNEHEHRVGKFKSALTLTLKNFREFPAVASQKLLPYKNKKIVLYCTGGIRCEKASAYLKQEGFTQVYQLQGGIINYVNQFPKGYWQGGLFVFDDRIVSEIASPLTVCQFCRQECSQYYNCHNQDCDDFFVCCDMCSIGMNKTCSEQCKTAPRQRKKTQKEIEKKVVGIIENYFAKKKVAAIRLSDHIAKNTTLLIQGKTTPPLIQKVPELWNEEGNYQTEADSGQLVTILVSEKVRKNDKVFVTS